MMNKGVEIMLARMESNPEEFENSAGWTTLYNEYKKFMEPEEQEAVVAKLKQIKMAKFEKDVLKKLFREENKQGELDFDVKSLSFAGGGGVGGTSTGKVMINTGGKVITFNGDRQIWQNVGEWDTEVEGGSP